MIVEEEPQSKYFGPSVKIINDGKAVPWFGAITGALEALYDTEAEAFFAGQITIDEALKNAETNTNQAIEQKLADLNL
jgi:ABC-type glycerol-3-phosphate transport system substrate-binding protein